MAGRKLFIINEFTAQESNTTGYYWSRIVGVVQRDFDGQTVVFSADSRPEDFPSNVKLVSLPRGHGGNVRSRVLLQAFMAVRIFIILLFLCRRGDLIISGSNPALQPPVVALVKTLKRCQWIQITFDLFPQNARILKIIGTRAVYVVIAHIYRWAYRTADVVLPVGDDMGAILTAMGVGEHQVKTVRNWAPPGAFVAGDGSASGGGDKITIQFLGNIGRAQGVRELLDVIDGVDNPDLSFTFSGGGAMAAEVAEFAKTHGNTVYLGSIAPQEATCMITKADICIVSLAPGMRGLGVPSKFYFNLAADKFLIFLGDEGSEIWNLITANPDLGRCFSHEDPQAMIDFLNRLSPGAMPHTQPGARSNYASTHHSEAAALAAYAAAFDPFLPKNELGAP